MNKNLFCRIYVVAILFSFQFIPACSQQKGKWEKDSVYNALQHVFPEGSRIELIDSGRAEQTDSLLNGWWMKAIINVPGDTSPTFFHFYHLTDTSVVNRILDASVKSQIDAASEKIVNPYITSFPFSDNTSNNALVYTLRIDISKSEKGDSAFENKICNFFKIPHRNSTIRIQDVKLEEVEQEPPPPPPPPKKKTKGK